MFCPQYYTIIAALFPCLLGMIYFFAYTALLFQIKGLIGRNGILPLSDFLNSMQTYQPRKRLLYAPTLFWINSSDTFVLGTLIIGVVLSILLMLGIFPPLMLFCLYLIHLSIISAGQDFLSFGWESFLLEITIYAFLMSLTPVPNLMIWIGINFLLFRFHLQAGIIKLQTRDPSWRNWTAIAFHYQTQPLPNAIAWYMHKLPLCFHKFSVLSMFVIELLIPFGIFGPAWMRLVVFMAFFALQLALWLIGNFSYLNQLTVVFCTILLSNSILSSFFSTPLLASPPNLVLQIFLSFIGLFLLILQVMRLWQNFWPNSVFKSILHIASLFHFANRHAIFGSMTTTRYEIVIEGSENQQSWKEYLF